jgi:UDP-2,3-diacylglucosamine hydrolase
MAETAIGMSDCLFISDLHLCDTRPAQTISLIAFLENVASQAQALYILGDLFEYWAGDDAIETGAQQGVIAALKYLSSTTPIYFVHGNRDFLLADGFVKAAGVQLLPDPSIVNLLGKRVLISHGDALCTDDISYQAFKQQVRQPAWINAFLSQPLASRVATIEHLRTKSEDAKTSKSIQIMDVNTTAVDELLRENDYPDLFIHGHTHRPNQHILMVDSHRCERWVLGDWYTNGSYLKLTAQGCSVHAL